ncbi:Lsr2 family DNA-binding protein [Nonomuraea jabiensis]
MSRLSLRVTYRTPKLGRTQIRDWARANGYPVSERGRIAPDDDIRAHHG